jgi:hypothetical protein
MATNKKISELTEFTADQMADDDLVVMVDVSDSTTKKVQASTFRATVSGVSTLSADAPLSVDAATGDVTMSLGTVAVAKGGTGATDAATARTNLGLEIGTDVQAYDAGLADIAGLAVTDGNIIVGDGANWVAESGATARTSLGLGTIATQDANNVNITGGTITGVSGIGTGDVVGPASSTDNAIARFDGTTGKLIQDSGVTVSDVGAVAAGSLTLTTDLAVADGGTGASDAATARTNLGLGTISTQAANSVNIDGGAIDGTTIGAASAAGGTFSALTVSGTTGQVATVTTTAGETQFTVTGGTVSGRLYSTGGGSQFIAGTFSNHPVTFYTNSTEKMRIESGGNVGIGTASPLHRLHLFASGDTYSRFTTTSYTTGFDVGITSSGITQNWNRNNTDWRVGTNNVERMRIDSSGNLKFNSGYGSVGTAYGCRVWVQYLGYDGTVNGSGNVSSVTDNGTGDFTVNFTSAMPDTNYSWAIGYSSNPGSAQRNRGFFELETISTGSSRIYQTDNAGSAWDMTITTFQVFR